MLPCRIAELKPVSARIVEIKLSSREITLCPVDQLDNGDFLFVKNLTRLHQGLRAHGEGMVNSVLPFGLFTHWVLAFAQQDVVVSNVEAGHDRIAEPPEMLKTQQIAVKLL